ncbi:hypothetical protein WMY93_011211 [Mugilogobius chulae]|uniref:La-related protein 4 n=1 Tax=Mugilogobius chulae TaxID=88201 RepID=A0AAW0P3B5_9GOBI
MFTARIKAINTFFGKSGFHSVDSSVFAQPPPQTPTPQPFGSPVFIDMQQVYSPQQQFPVYPVVSPSWSPTPVPYFETPLAPFQNGGFMNGYRNSGNYKGNSLPMNGHRPRSRNQGYGRAQDVGSGCLVDVSPQAQVSEASVRPNPDAMSPTGISLKDGALLPPLHNGDSRPRRPNHRGMRRKREDELNTKPLSTAEVKAPPPNFDLASCNFPPLPGSVAPAKEETALDVCMADVVRGLKVSDKTSSQETKETKLAEQSEYVHSKPESPATQTPPEVEPHTSCTLEPSKEDTAVDMSVSIEDSPSEVTVSEEPTAKSTAATTTSQSAPAVSSPSVSSPSAPSPTSEPEPKKLSYAEVCQRLAKDPPPPPAPSAPSPPPSSEPAQPLQELKVNRVQEPRHKYNPDNKPRHHQHHQHQRPSRPFHDSDRTAPKNRDRSRNFGKSFSGQRGFKRSGKEQNIPPSPKN